MNVTRRAFAWLVGAGFATNALSQSGGVAAALQSEVEARINWVLGKYGSRLNDEQKADVRRLITSGQSGIDAMRAYSLDNAVEPATIFRVRRPQ